ncbi:PREDICTED: uncharacterized protein LOC109186594 [Ipomoea nil]|uniref:uncharacterized protein LOC109186594 n=1 Tax=Ipomoea nil TaxID=35883 RepID=UPI000900A5D7|nr:PREDICTED: uncharacterized protein LOC109186594 [Ipomoea nil]XP_019192190.1 PREDICTED: uncharacterized protein LOC109186594 [Ipomoea nil]XP_019192191.1 PREDICTED: uncharacterized protein LOC109186594 [Ipomoea nil]
MAATDKDSKTHNALQVSTSQRGLISEEDPEKQVQGRSVLALPIPKRLQFLKLGSLASPPAKFQQIPKENDGVRIRDRLNRLFSRKFVWKICREWIRNPLNMALLIWIVCVTISGAILFLVMTGMLNHALPKKSQRDIWFEVNNQIINALFTLMCLYQHPRRLYHFVLLFRWRPADISWLRKVYCKNGTCKPNEWGHMMVVVLLLNLNCFAQYVLCGLNLGYPRSERPALGVGICLSVSIGAPAIAGVYSMISPLGKNHETRLDEEAEMETTRAIEARGEWSGGVFDFWDDISSAYLSLCCTFCVFGWNMERLGLGNMYVHIATFMLFCMAPFWIFTLAAVNLDNESVRAALGVTGILLCVFGLMYGGFWRIQMRKRYNLPPYSSCWGEPSVADCALWLFCCCCSLAQEVRTGNSYEKMVDQKHPNFISPLPREDGLFRSNPMEPPAPVIVTRDDV